MPQFWESPKARARGTARSSSRSDLLPTITRGTFSSSLMRMICSRSSESSFREEALVIEKTSRNPWPCFMYSSLVVGSDFVDRDFRYGVRGQGHTSWRLRNIVSFEFLVGKG